MPTNAFVSFDHDDQNQVNGFKGLNTNPNHPLDFHDRSLETPIADRRGKPIAYPPSDPKSKPVRDAINKKFKNASKLIVLIGQDTHGSEWVDWEIKTFHEMKKRVSGENTWRRIRGMKLKNCEDAKIPSELLEKSTKVLEWDPGTLDKWLDENPDG